MAKTGYTIKSIKAMTLATIKHLSESEQRKVYSTLAMATNKRVKRLKEAGVENFTQFYDAPHFSVHDIDNMDSGARTMAIGRLYAMLTSKGNTVKQARLEKKVYIETWKKTDYDSATIRAFKELFDSDAYYEVYRANERTRGSTKDLMKELKKQIAEKEKEYATTLEDIEKALRGD